MLYWNVTMDREILKRTLKEQVVPLDEAVRNKIKYLLSDEVFMPSNEDNYGAEAETMSFTDAFGVNTISSTNTSTQSAAGAVSITPTHSLNSIPQAASFAEHKQSIAEKIAALRGITDISANYARPKK